MKYYRILLGLVGISLLLNACAASPEAKATQVALAATSTAAAWTPTATATNTATATATNTATATATNTATATATATSTATATATNTPTPEAGQLDADGRYREAASNFSYIPPEGWEVKDYSLIKYKIVSGPIIDTFGTNLVFVDESYPGSLESYVKLSLKTFKQLYPTIKIVSQKSFSTDAGIPAIKLITNNEYNKVKVYQIYYFFDGGSKKYAGIYSRVPGTHKDIDAIVDTCMASFQIEE